MKTEKPKKLIRWYILGAIGAVLMAAGDWLLGCVPLQAGDTGMFNRVHYLSGSYGLWKPVLTVGLGAIGGFLYYFVVPTVSAAKAVPWPAPSAHRATASPTEKWSNVTDAISG